MGTASLYFLPPKAAINETKYITLLQNKLQLHVSVHNSSIFMHDGAMSLEQGCEAIPGAKDCASAGLAGQQPRPQSYRRFVEFDEAKVAERYPSNLNKLQQEIKEVWVNELSSKYCFNLISSMPRRLLVKCHVAGI